MGVLALRAPALTPKEIQGTHLFVFWVSLCFFGGLLFGYFVMAPLSINFFANYQASEFITNMFDISDYLTTVIIVSIACAFMFELPLLIYFLTRMGLVSAGIPPQIPTPCVRHTARRRGNHNPARHIQPHSGDPAAIRAV